MTQPKTLNEAREQLEAANNQLAELQAQVAAHDSVLASFGITRGTDATGVHYLDNPRLAELTAQNTELQASIATLTGDKKALTEIAAGHESSIATLTARITELESSVKTRETLARELVGNLGGAPLAVDSSQSLTSAAELRAGLGAEKDPAKKWELFKRLESIKKNGTEK